MGNNKVKVVGYAKKEIFEGGIEYRNFSPDLVGVQLASDGGTPLFTMGNFSITTNMEPKTDKNFITNNFSQFITLSELNLTLDETNTLLVDNANVILKLDKTKLKNYALFGSLTEFVRVSLENVIINWPASLYMVGVAQNSQGQTLNGYTYEDYTYDLLTNISTFKINTTFINNKFNLNFLLNGNIINTYNSTNDLRNVTINYDSYVVYTNGIEYPLIGFTGATYTTTDYIYLNVKGNPFSGMPTSAKVSYHIKPNKLKEEQFFNSLPDFEYYLLNRNIIPAYTAKFKYPTKSDEGVILYITETVTWPVSDGYNIDFDTTGYIDYATKLLNISANNDLYSSDLMNRFLVTESISAFDTMPVHLSEQDRDSSGQKMNKTLRIYGRSFDDLNNFITGIAFANTVTYDQLDNTPDVYLKNLASVLGWDLIGTIMENNLLSNYVTTAPSQFSGETVGLTPVEADIELWRRIILNTPWIWKSKGARKSIEFLLRFIGAPEGLVKFNEYIYKANGPIDIDLFKQTLTLNGLDDDISIYPIDSDGYPNPLPDTDDIYFQGNGLWYRETAGSGSTIDILTGNNPHAGPYDGGGKYINQFKTLIPNFSAVTISSQTTTTGTINLFYNNELGTYDGTQTGTSVSTVVLTSEEGEDLSDCYVFTPTVIGDVVNPGQVFNACGCPTDGTDNILSLCVDKNQIGDVSTLCNEMETYPTISDTTGLYTFYYYQYNQDGSIFVDVNNNPVVLTSDYTNMACCSIIGGSPILYDTVVNDTVINTGYACCNSNGKCGCTAACSWRAITQPILLPLPTSQTYNGTQNLFLEFTKANGDLVVTTSDGCNCISGYTTPVSIEDPYTGLQGIGCQLTTIGESDALLGVNSVIYNFYKGRADGKSSCYE